MVLFLILQIGVSVSAEMQPISQTSLFWPKLIDIASDCHEQNIKLRKWNSKDTFILQATRDISAGQKLQLWFSEDLMISDLGIPPYLSPYNIKGMHIFTYSCVNIVFSPTENSGTYSKFRLYFCYKTGGNSYVCHECHEEFERPNPLKLHLALHCDRLSSETIWNRLKSSAQSPLLVNPGYVLNLSPTITSSSSPNPVFNVNVSSSTSTPLESILRLSPPIHQVHNRHTLFPIPDTRMHASSISCTGLTSSSTSSSTPSPVIEVDAPVEVPSPATEASSETSGRSLVVQEQHHHHARLEAIVSNMGKAKNGHVCLYCGKLYSRKYGLKIHIRTHTGYKPLRCKICHRPFGDPSNLNKHVRLHSDGSTPYR